MNNFKLQSDPIGEVIFNGIVYVPKEIKTNSVSNNIQQFLESTKEIELHDGAYLDLSDHNAKLVNLVLEEVEREVEKSENAHFSDYPGSLIEEAVYERVSTIINNLRIK